MGIVKSGKYDVALVGVGTGLNYGSVMTYYSLYKTIESFGKSVLMISKIGAKSNDIEAQDTHANKFAKEHYNLSQNYSQNSIKNLNEVVETFVVGSDQVWNYGISKGFGKAFYLDFAEEQKRKISYAASFGHAKDFAPPEEREKISALMKRFDAISVREDSGVQIASEFYKVEATQVAEPIFLLDADDYLELARRSDRDVSEPYLLAYILDPTPEKKEAIIFAAKKLNLRIRIVLDGFHNFFEQNKNKMDMHGAIEESVDVYDFLKLFANSAYVITDSFHGTVFSLKFQKPFASIGNKARGMTRFTSLFNLIGIRERFTVDPNEIIKNEVNFFKKINYKQINKIINDHVEYSKEWLISSLNKVIPENRLNKAKNDIFYPDEKKSLLDILLNNKFVFYREGAGGDILAQNVVFLKDGSLINTIHENESFWKLNGDKLIILNKSGKITTIFNNLNAEYISSEFRISGEFQDNEKIKHVLESVPAAVKRADKDPDFLRVKILLAKMRDYGVKDVVLSPGGRDVVLVRGFEKNKDYFNIHYVIDERSAGYYAMGIANKTQKPTAVVVTSGTAASNLTPAMTEAFYMNLPLLAVTADRYPEFHGIGEDQTIEQESMFEPMVRKSVNLTVATGGLNDWFINRKVSEAILATKYGPAHINISIKNLPKLSPIKAAYNLPKLKHIRQISSLDETKVWQEYSDILLRSNKIMLLYRQNFKPKENQLRNLEKFCEIYNVVVVADWLSNIYGPRVVHPFNAISSMSQEEFNKNYKPDILISMGTKNVMNHPINEKLRKASGFRHWDIQPNGDLKDLYFKLSSILEVNQDWFFEKMIDLGGKAVNNNYYLNAWQSIEKKTMPPQYSDYHNKFVVQQLLEQIPENSLFHIGVGSSFMLTHSVNTVPNKKFEVFLNMGTNGIDGSASSFMGQVSVDDSDRLKFLLIGDVSFFYDMNSIWNKSLKGNIRIILVNNSGSSLLRNFGSKGAYAPHAAIAEGWVKSVGFDYMSSRNKSEFLDNLRRFVSDEKSPMFFEVFL